MNTIKASEAFTTFVSPGSGMIIPTTTTGKTHSCTYGRHYWTYAGQSYDLEGIPCDCGEVTYHTEVCPVCECRFTKHNKAR